MSVASEFAPEVYIPARARRTTPAQRHLAAVPAGPQASATGWHLDRNASRVGGARLRNEPVRLCDDEIRSGAAPLRLTRRGVIALIAIGVLAAGLFLLVAHASLGLAPASSAEAPTVTGSVVVVQDGDTLWSIAQRVQPKADPRQVVDRLRRVNHLGSVALSPGQTLKVG